MWCPNILDWRSDLGFSSICPDGARPGCHSIDAWPFAICSLLKGSKDHKIAKKTHMNGPDASRLCDKNNDRFITYGTWGGWRKGKRSIDDSSVTCLHRPITLTPQGRLVLSMVRSYVKIVSSRIPILILVAVSVCVHRTLFSKALHQCGFQGLPQRTNVVLIQKNKKS